MGLTKRFFERRFISARNMAKLLFMVVVILLLTALAKGQIGDTFFGKNGEACSDDSCVPNTADGRTPEAVEGGELVTDEAVSSQASELNIVITFTNAVHNRKLTATFTLTVKSLLELASVPVVIHIIGEAESQKLASSIIKDNAGTAQYRMVNLDVDQLAKELNEIVKPMQDHFSYKPGAYYNHALFFLSIAIHKVLPETMDRVIMLDADLKFKADIKELYDRFEQFTEENVIGIGRDMQPVYRHTFSSYRSKNPDTRVGGPPPDGLTGFNSGVLLLDLNRMRNSKLYNSLITGGSVKQLSEEFLFKGHLGDQDFFSLLSMKYENLFHVIPCNWNRQLCTWWRDHGYKGVFDEYFTCKGDIKIFHGNCGTPIPSD